MRQHVLIAAGLIALAACSGGSAADDSTPVRPQATGPTGPSTKPDKPKIEPRPTGPTSPTGPTGPTSPTGPTGPTSPTGPTGPTPDPVNDGWVGGSCASNDDCTVDGATCKTEADGFPDGMCSLPCGGSFCTDTAEPNTTTTFCTTAGTPSGATCVARCAFDAYNDTGCREGYICSARPRYDFTPTFTADVCVPAAAGLAPVNDCHRNLGRDSVGYNNATNSRTVCPGSSPAQVCDVIDAVKFKSPIDGVKLLANGTSESDLYGRCDLAAAMQKVVEIAKKYDIVELHHFGTYNCRVIAGTTHMSQHGTGAAIDISAVVLSNRTKYTINSHFEAGTDHPTTAGGKLLYDFVHELHDAKVFNIILTPNFNAAHRDHFHMDLTPGSDFLGREPEYVLREFDGEE